MIVLMSYNVGESEVADEIVAGVGEVTGKEIMGDGEVAGKERSMCVGEGEKMMAAVNGDGEMGLMKKVGEGFLIMQEDEKNNEKELTSIPSWSMRN